MNSKENLDVKLNYFNFSKFRDRYLITNDFGKFLFLSSSDFNALMSDRKALSKEMHDKLTDNYFIYEDKEIFAANAALEMKKFKNYLYESTQLHIFVLTTYCNLSCTYCQASAAKEANKTKYKFMSTEVAEKSVDIALQSSSDNLVFEFQGGEPLANFKVLKHIVEYTNEKNKELNKNITYNLVSNLTLITDDMIRFLIDNNVTICTSIDGPEFIHNKNRVYSDGNCLQLIKDNMKKINECNEGRGNCVQAIQTTTKYSLSYAKEIVDEYIGLGLNSLFIRPLTPIGYAASNWSKIGYSTEEFLRFYEECLDYLISLSIHGACVGEGHAIIFLKKILKNLSINYMELRSPCGGVIGQLAYNYDGNIYTCDEGRMLAETGDFCFKLGDVYSSNLSELLSSTTCKTLCVSSCLESIPGCEQCVYGPYCGVCPVCNYAQYNNLFAQSPNSYKCKVYKGILEILFKKILEGKSEVIEVFNKWIE